MAGRVAADGAGASEPAQGPAPLTGAYAGYAMTLLLCLYLVNFLDRQVVHILGEPIKRDLHLADWQLGLMSGLAFALLYTILGIPIAWLAERRSRPAIIGAAATVWSGFTLLCGMAQSFPQLVLARIGVGVGEAGCTPAAQSLIMDYARPEKRSSALAYYGLGAPIGGLVGMAFGGLVADAYGWRAAFLVAGLPGLVLGALAAFTLREPRRAMARRVAEAKAEGPGVSETFRHLLSKPAFVNWAAALMLMSLPLAALPPFLGSFYLRNHADGLARLAEAAGSTFGVHLQSVGVLGLSLGLILGTSGALGMWLGGQIADRFGRGSPRRYAQGAALATVLGAPLMIAAVIAPTLELSLALLALKGVVWSLWYGAGYAAGFSVVPRNMRATASALSLFINNLVGTGFGAVAVGALSDLIGTRLGSGEGVRWSIVVFSLCGAGAAVMFLRAARTIEAEAAE